MVNEISIPLSKRKLKWIMAGSAAFILLSVLLLAKADIFMDTEFKKIVSKIAGAAGILFFSIALYYSFKKMQSKKPGLIITNEGLIDNSSGISIGLVLWKDVTGFKEFTSNGTKNLIIGVNNPEQYIEKADSFVTKKMLQANNKLFKSPIAIAAVSLIINYEELKRLIIEGYQNYLDVDNFPQRNIISLL